jgi:DNA-binding Lrp family transcriptional regulator
MQPFKIKIDEVEFQVVLSVLPNLPDGTSLRSAADTLNMNENHLRYIVDELVKNGRINKVEVDDRPHHKRFRYEVTK